MSLLSYDELHQLVEQGVIKNVRPGAVKGASIDVYLANEILEPNSECIVSIKNNQAPGYYSHNLAEDKFFLFPSRFVLGSTIEVFNLPNDIAATFALNSTTARLGLNHCMAGFCDPGWRNAALTLEYYNASRNVLLLEEGMRAGQMQFWRVKPVPEQANYKNTGRYNGTLEVAPARPSREAPGM